MSKAEMPTEDEAQFVVTGLSLRIGGIQAVHDVSFVLPKGATLGLVGPNGAGKSSLLNSVSGFYRPQDGHAVFEGVPLLGLRPDRVAALGIGRAFQHPHLIPELTVVENLLVGRHAASRRNVLWSMLHFGPGRQDELKQREVVEGVIELLEMEHLRTRSVAQLPYGQQKLVEIARAVTSSPRLLLLDEPVSGMAVEEKQDVARFIIRLREEMDMSLILVEHDVRFVRDLCDSLVVLDAGKVIASGKPADALATPAVMHAYLGGANHGVNS